MTQEQAIAVLTAHSIETRIECGKLQALEAGTYRDAQGKVQPYEFWVDIKLEYTWLRRWLGY